MSIKIIDRIILFLILISVALLIYGIIDITFSEKQKPVVQEPVYSDEMKGRPCC